MDKLISKEDFINATNLRKYKLGGLADLLMQVMRISRVNEIYEELHQHEGKEFISTLLDTIQVKYEVSEREMENIPAEGPFITVSNHPYGGIDGILLLDMILGKRPDYKLMANFLLQMIKPISDFFLPVNPFENQQDKVSSIAGVKRTLEHIRSGKPIGIFPAGEVSTYQTDLKLVSDKVWQPAALRIIHKAGVPVVPVFFHGGNSRMFHILGMIHPMLRTAKLPSEMFNKKNSVIRIRVGRPISPDYLSTFEDPLRMGRFLRSKTYSLGSALDVKTFYGNGQKKKMKPVVPPIDTAVLKEEIKSLGPNKVLTHNNFELYVAQAKEIPNILNEIGRLREITFREVGEGTSRNIDLDEYDLYYHQLFIWDKAEERIIGGYRMGKGSDILTKFSLEGFYINSLFKLDEALRPIMKEAVELGRSFVVREYQQKMLPLFLLWKGILHFMAQNKEYRYLIGPVSISNRYSDISKSLIIEFIKANYFDHELAKYVTPRNRYKVEHRDIDLGLLLEGSNSDLKTLENFIEELEPAHYSIPVLLKKYIRQNARIIGFNIDPDFENALDGLMILDMNEVPTDTIEGLNREFKVGG